MVCGVAGGDGAARGAAGSRNVNPKARARSGAQGLRAPQIADDGAGDILRRNRLIERSLIARKSHWQQPRDGNQAKPGHAQRKGYLDKGKRPVRVAYARSNRYSSSWSVDSIGAADAGDLDGGYLAGIAGLAGRGSGGGGAVRGLETDLDILGNRVRIGGCIGRE